MLRGYKKYISVFLIILVSFFLCSCSNDNVYIKVNINKGDKFKVNSISKITLTSNSKKYYDSYREYSGTLECLCKNNGNIESEVKVHNNKMKVVNKDEELVRIDKTNIKSLDLYNAINKIDGIIETDTNWKYIDYQLKNKNKEIDNVFDFVDYSKKLVYLINSFNNKALVENQISKFDKNIVRTYITGLNEVDIDKNNFDLKYKVENITSKYALLRCDFKEKDQNITYRINSKTTIDLATGICTRNNVDIQVENVEIPNEEGKVGTINIKNEINIVKKI